VGGVGGGGGGAWGGGGGGGGGLPFCSNVARLLRNIRLPTDPPPPVYAIHHTILVMAILCKERVA